MKLGEKVELDAVGKRDAFHVSAVVATVERGNLSPGESVKFIDASLKYVERCLCSERHAIVDPFQKHATPAGNAVLVLLQPDAVHSLSHHFEVNFPGLPPAPVEESDEAYEEYDECQGCY